MYVNLSMKTLFFILFLVFTVGIYCTAYGQDVFDTTHVPGIYKKIESFSSKRKFTRLLHGLILKPVNTTSSSSSNSDTQKNSFFVAYEGKIIRNIHIVTLDPFGYSILDTNSHPRSFLEKSGNSLHLKTQNKIIRNRLLIHKNEPFDSLFVNESERLIRSQTYIHDVSTTVLPLGANSDSVDVYFRVLDLWSIIADGGLSAERGTFQLTDKNLIGFGHTFSSAYTQNFTKGTNAFSAYYFVPNFKKTYINSRIDYSIDENKDYIKSIQLERPFFSPITRWAGGAFVSQQKQARWVYKNDTTRLFLNSRYNIQDYWAAAAWQVFKGNSEAERTTKLILSARAFRIKYLRKPTEQAELLDFYTNENLVLAGIGISSRKYIKQRYIFKYGTTEDVPIGLAYGVVGGYQLKNNEHWYWGLRYSWSNFLNWGYFGTHLEYGTFINASKNIDGVFKVYLNYFSNLFAIGTWKFRQFVKPELTIGINRTPFTRLSLNDGYGINGFNSDELSGTSRFLVVFQTQSYAPWNLMGFRFGPYLNISFGMMGNENNGFQHSRVYPQIGLGLLVKNDYLIFRYFQFSFAFYPSIPGKGYNIFKANPIRTTDFGLPDFILGKPEIVDFR